MAKLPLEGIRVIEIGLIWAAPVAAQMLADMGAEVIRVESLHHWQPATRGATPRPPAAAMAGAGGASYPNRDAGKRPWNRSASFNQTNRNKLSMTVDLTRPKGKEIFKRLIKISDVFVENNAAGLMDRLGLGYSVLREMNPSLIHCAMPGFGCTGPYKDYLGFGALLESMAGHDWLRGYADSDPTSNNTIYPCDSIGAATGAFAILCALHYRNQTGKGQFIDLAQVEAFVSHLGQAVMDYTMNQRVQRTVGNRDPGGAMVPHGCYRCKGEDRWVVIAVSSDEEWEGFCRALGNPPWTKEEKFSDYLSRWNNQDELNKHIEKWASQRDRYAVMRLLQKEGVAAGPVMDARDACNDPHLIDRGFFEEVTHPETGTYLQPGIIAKFSKTPLSIRRHAPCLGEHNEYVYKELLRVSDDEYAELEKEQHIGLDFIER